MTTVLALPPRWWAIIAFTAYLLLLVARTVVAELSVPPRGLRPRRTIRALDSAGILAAALVVLALVAHVRSVVAR